jgi:protein-S-isoprenylcysteine O-methyltransferase Ste14
MIKPTGNVWPILAINFAMFSIFSLMYVDDIIGNFFSNSGFDFWKFLTVLMSISILIGFVGHITKSKIRFDRVLVTALIFGFVGFLPMVLLMSIFAIGYALALQNPTRLIFLTSLFVVTFFWCVYQFHEYRQRIIERHFMEKEFYVGEERIIMHAPQRVKLDAAPITNQTFLGRIYNKFGPYLFLLIPFAYPIQKSIGDKNGFYGVSILLGILATPVAIYLLARLTCGAYLYVYKVWQLERKYGKPVMFD